MQKAYHYYQSCFEAVIIPAFEYLVLPIPQVLQEKGIGVYFPVQIVPVMLDNFCWCDTSLYDNFKQANLDVNTQTQFGVDSAASQTLSFDSSEEQNPDIDYGNYHIKQRKRLLLERRLRGLEPKIYRALNMVTNQEAILITSRTKPIPRRSTNSHRRSNFIGVFKNCQKWQSTIAINGIKTYIGTYNTQLEAAKAFDYHSILLHGMNAITNFDYCKRSIEELFSEQRD